MSLHHNGANSYLFVNITEINPYELCLGNISKDWSIYNMKKTSWKGCVYDFSVDYDAISVSDILDIHKYLMEENGLV